MPYAKRTILGAVNAEPVLAKSMFLPPPTKQSQHYWDRCHEHKLVMQKCSKCGRFRHYPRPRCPFCLAKEFEWTELSGKGTVYTFTVVHRPPYREMPTPYVVAQVELDEKVRMMTQIVGCDPQTVHIGMPVRVDFEDLNDVTSVPVFRPATA